MFPREYRYLTYPTQRDKSYYNLFKRDHKRAFTIQPFEKGDRLIAQTLLRFPRYYPYRWEVISIVSKAGYLDLLKLFAPFESNEIDLIVRSGTKGGCLNTVKFAVKLGFSLDRGLSIVGDENFPWIVKYLFKQLPAS